MLAALRTLTQGGHTHLWLAFMARAAQTWVVPFRREIIALVHHVVSDVHTRLSCWRNRSGWYQYISTNMNKTPECYQTGLFCTSLAEEGEFFVAVFGVPAVQAPLVHALDLKALQLGTEHVILGWVRLAEISQTLRRQKHLHGPCEEQTDGWGNGFKRPQM